MTGRLMSLTEVVAIAHRGGARLRPENTLVAFEHAVSLGVDALECDVRLSRDGEPVVIHDDTLDRTTDAHGPVGDRTAAELARVDAGARFERDGRQAFRGMGLGVPRLAELLDRHRGHPVIVEMKPQAPAVVERVAAVVREAGAGERVLFGSFSHDLLDRMRRVAPDLPTSASGREVRSAVRRALFRVGPSRPMYAVMQAPYRFRGRRVFGAGFVRTIRRAGIPVQAWIVDAEDDMRRLIDWGVTGVISDRPDLAVQVVAARRGAARPPEVPTA